MPSFGFDIRDASQGASAITNILSQGDQLSQEKAKTSILQQQATASQTPEAQAKAEYEASRYKALTGFMNKPTAGTLGAEAYANLDATQKLSYEKKQLAQKEANLAGLAPEDRAAADRELESTRNHIATQEAKVQELAAKHLGTVVATLDSMKDPKSFTGGVQFLREEFSGMADEAIKDGKMSPENKEAFIRDKLKGSGIHLDSNGNPLFDEVTKAGIAAKMNEGMSQKERIDTRLAAAKEKHEENYRLKTLAEAAKANRIAASQVSSVNLRTLQDLSTSVNNTAKDSASRLKEIDSKDTALSRDLNSLQRIINGSSTTPPIPKKIKDPSAGLFERAKMIDNPEYIGYANDLKEIQDKRAKLQADRSEEERVHKTATVNAETVRERMGLKGVSSPKESKPALGTEANPIVLD